MSDFKLSEEGVDVTEAGLNELIINTKYPTWKCDLRRNPKHYGLVKIDRTAIAGESTVIYTLEHGYGYTPSYITGWYYPAGTNKYGIGRIDFFSGGDSVVIDTEVNDTTFKITVSSGGLASGDYYVELRFYIFAEDFPLYTYAPLTLDT